MSKRPGSKESTPSSVVILSNKSLASMSAGRGVAGVSSQGIVFGGNVCVLVEPGDIKELQSVVTSMLPTDSEGVGIMHSVPATSTLVRFKLCGIVDMGTSSAIA